MDESRIRLARATGAGVVLLAAALAVATVLTQCTDLLKLASGATVPMKCHWTAMAAVGIAIPLALAGVGIAFSKRAETLRMLALLVAALGAVIILLPTVLIGVCANPDHLCNSAMRPAMIFMGVLTLGAAAFVAWTTRRQPASIA
jgi:hypothetical protein